VSIHERAEWCELRRFWAWCLFLIGTVSKMAKVATVVGFLGDEHSLPCDVIGIGNMMVMRGSRSGGG
jgi:hypothetical protein